MKYFENAIVITGTIASGKTSVGKILKNLGYIVIDADKITHKILDENYKKIARIFGNEFIIDRKVDRKKLGALVFYTPSKLKILENFLYPKIKQEIIRLSEKLRHKKLFFVDIPLYYEKGNFKDIFKKVLVVYSTNEDILQRLIKRDNLSKDEAINRINLQLDIEIKAKMADFVIKNDTNYEELQNKVDKFLKSLK